MARRGLAWQGLARLGKEFGRTINCYYNKMANIQRTILQDLQRLFGNPEKKLKPLSLEESKDKCKKIRATSREIKIAKQQVRYICEKCSYHSEIIRRCPACGSWLRYWQLYERILYHREK